MPDIQFECPHCQHVLVVDDQAAGLSLPCPRCAASVAVPDIPVGRLPPVAAPEGISPGIAAGVTALRSELRTLQDLVNLTAERIDALGQWSARQGRELDHVGQQSHQLEAKAQAILQRVTQTRGSHAAPLIDPVGQATDLSSPGALGRRLGFWKGMTLFWTVAALASAAVLSWLWGLAMERDGEDLSLVNTVSPHILRPPELTKNDRIHVAWESAALPRREGERAVLRAVLRNPSITRDLWLSGLADDVRILGREGRLLSHRASTNPPEQKRLAPGGEMDVFFWLPEAEANEAVSLMWYPGVWVEEGGEKVPAFAGAVDVRLDPPAR
jgi:hypothetical protein